MKRQESLVYRTVKSTDVTDPSECGGIELPTSEDPAGQITAKTCAFWTEFRNFSPDPTAPFLKDFERLAQLESWSKNEKRKNLVKALNSEIDFHKEDKSTELVRWHRLCQEIGVDSKPTSVTGCKRVLHSHKVNLYSLVDHRRNSEISVVCFGSFEEFAQDIARTGTFPRQCAKRDGCMRGLLKKMK
ncbi:hypothetical protein AA0117_g13160 [Alternaria alternata]|uniref:Uncharacterized protein n=3 Tax=Alternaria alternata complex TaxID=187734 RepID=A0A4Q4MSN7_ALTAL|nr:hypothetical protein AA0115_g12975 [Alternaria tenuissima]RYN28572.1 hypothetical protein AA0114_g12458 [Alternaria tenuissima]RYN58608.1 hypothetical protein AA0117_g13160 [Alternaria alternata]